MHDRDCIRGCERSRRDARSDDGRQSTDQRLSKCDAEVFVVARHQEHVLPVEDSLLRLSPHFTNERYRFAKALGLDPIVQGAHESGLSVSSYGERYLHASAPQFRHRFDREVNSLLWRYSAENEALHGRLTPCGLSSRLRRHGTHAHHLRSCLRTPGQLAPLKFSANCPRRDQPLQPPASQDVKHELFGDPALTLVLGEGSMRD